MSLIEAIDMLRLVDPAGADAAQDEWEELEEERDQWERDYDEKAEEFDDMERERDEALEALGDIKSIAKDIIG